MNMLNHGLQYIIQWSLTRHIREDQTMRQELATCMAGIWGVVFS